MSRRKRLSGSDPFGGSEDPKETGRDAPVSPEEIDKALFGNLSPAERAREEIKPVPIGEVFPDPSQPRRVLPSALRQMAREHDLSPAELLSRWMDQVDEERESPFDLAAFFAANDPASAVDESELDDEVSGPLERGFLEIVRLAASIRRDGLTNPVTVVRSGRRWRLETGERRWLAFHLLHHFLPDEAERQRWAKIPARRMGEFDVWRQASENNARTDLNAIARARQFAVLMMDLIGQRRFRPFEDFEDDQDYYAQVADMSPPYGKSDLILNAMGVKHRNAISRYRSLLKLPPQVWQLADDLDWTERQLRPLTPPTPPDEAVALALQMAGMSPTGDNSATGQRPAWDRSLSKVETQFSPSRWQKMAAGERRAAYERLRTILLKLEEMGFDA